MTDEIGLGELITKVKEELLQTNKLLPALLVEKVELELQVTISKTGKVSGSAEGKAELKINVFSLDIFKVGEGSLKANAERQNKRDDLHKVTVTLSPAVLNAEFMNSLDETTKQVVLEANKKINLQGDKDRI